MCNTLNACLYAHIDWIGSDWIGLHIDYLLCDANDRFKSKSPNASLECGLLPQFNLLFIATAKQCIQYYVISTQIMCYCWKAHTRIIVGSHLNGNPTAPDWNVSFWNLNAIRWVVIWLQHGSSSELFRLAAAVVAAAVLFHWAVPLFTLIWSDRIGSRLLYLWKTSSDYATTMLMTDRFECNTFQTYHITKGFSRKIWIQDRTKQLTREEKMIMNDQANAEQLIDVPKIF